MTLEFIKDDGGREAAGYRGKAGDCVPRALTIVSGEPYRQCYNDLAEANSKVRRTRPRDQGKRSARNGVYKNAYDKVFKHYGFEKVKLGRGTRPTISEAHAAYGDCIITTRKHVFAVVNGAVRDTWDCRMSEVPLEGTNYMCGPCAYNNPMLNDIVDSGKDADDFLRAKRLWLTGEEFFCPNCEQTHTSDVVYGQWVMKRERKAMTIWILPSRYDWQETESGGMELELSADVIMGTAYSHLTDDNWF